MSLVAYIICCAACLVYPPASIGAAFSPIESWTYKAGVKIGETPKFYPSSFEPTHVIVVSQEGTVTMVGPTGKPVWKTTLDGECLAPVGIGDLNGDGSAEIVVGLHDGNVVALDQSGIERWRYKMAGRISTYRCPMLVDLDDDGQCEVILTDDRGFVDCLSSTGDRLWRFRIDPYYASSTAAADLDLDGNVEIVYGTENNRVVCLTSSGVLKWVRNIEGKFARTAPSLGDVNGDGYLDVAVTMSFNSPDTKMYLLSGPTGEVLWQSPIDMWAYASNVIADLDRDGSPEVICCGRGRRIHVFNADGTLRWKKISENDGSYKETAVADINGDGRHEIIVGTRSGPGFEVFTDMGTYLGEFGEDVCHVTPLVGDLDRDGKLEIIVAKTDKGELVCYDLEAPAEESSVSWPTYRANSANTGVGFYPKPASQPSVVKHERGKLNVSVEGTCVWGANRAKIEWPSSLPDLPFLEVSVAPKQGASHADVLALDRKNLPETILFDIEHIGRNTVTFALLDGEDGKPLATDSVTVKNSGVKSLASWMQSRLDRLAATSNDLLKTDPKISLRLRHMQAARQMTLSTIADLAASKTEQTDSEHDNLMQMISDLRTDLERDVRLAQILAESSKRGPIPPVLIWPDPNPWDEASLWDTIAGYDPTQNAQLPTWLYRNEYEDIALNLLNVTPDPVTIQVRTDTNALEHVDIREALQVPRYDGSWVTDPLSELNAARTIVLPPGDIRQIWFVYDSKGLDAGSHEYEIELLLLGHENLILPVTIQAHVEDIDLAAAPSFMRCNWSSPARFRSAGLSDELIKPSIESGMNVIVGIPMPARECDKQGSLIGEVDWSPMDHDLTLLTPECFLLFGNISLKTPAGIQVGDPVWSKACRAWADELTQHLTERGFPLSHWALYPLDEPGLYDGPRIRDLERLVIPVKNAAPDVPIYANPSGEVTEENFYKLLPYVDVWCPELGALLRRPHMVDFFLNDEGARVWCYEAPGTTKHLLPLGYYRSQSLIAFSIGLEGAGYWTQFYSPHDIWLNQTEEEWGTSYPGPGGIWVESRRWHATRDGTEDARAYRLLKELTKKAREKGVAKDICDQAEKLLKTDLVSALELPMRADDVTRFVYVHYDPDLTELQSLRKHAADLTRALWRALGN
ncbi:MAG: FG-GAP-like repeat-containing protein [bacterium]